MIRVYAQTDVGRVRRGNEDNFLVGETTSEKIDRLPGVEEFSSTERGLVLMVSDGMGGAAAGEVASRLAVQVTREEMRFEHAPEETEFRERLEEALQEANRIIAEEARRNPGMRGMGATATTAGILRNKVFIGQVGDSRAYLLRGNDMQQLTRDQSFVNQLVEAGKITEEEAEVHPRRNVILQALGNQARLNVVMTTYQALEGDYLLLCSDGLSGLVKKEEMARIIHASGNIQEACQQMIALANNRGGHDNITVILAHFIGAEFRSSESDETVELLNIDSEIYPPLLEG
ncbi:MAG: Stp1/IreP family PP2C-type Ser/Thr phosphatase [Calditrichaeota bacterium]|nr:MAG: Stp1/IreP family PP2C-type Ser/Thr phosphatase [Calditrichota bacterium]